MNAIPGGQRELPSATIARRRGESDAAGDGVAAGAIELLADVVDVVALAGCDEPSCRSVGDGLLQARHAPRAKSSDKAGCRWLPSSCDRPFMAGSKPWYAKDVNERETRIFVRLVASD
jgi:hypothetical protein